MTALRSHSLIDLTGLRYGRLTVLSRAPQRGRSRGARWHCVCDCGTKKETSALSLRKGVTVSCGCFADEKRRENIKAAHAVMTSHGMTKTSEYKIWAGMRVRCEKTISRSYKNYGGRGIKICRRWSKFENFFADMGKRPPGMSLDRIDNDKGYSPSNCRWATSLEQMRNRRPSPLWVTRPGTVRLYPKQILEIRARYERGEPTPSIAKDFGVTSCRARAIGKRQTWGWLEP